MERMQQTDISREWMKFSKFIQFWRIFFQEEATRVLDSYSNFSKIDFNALSWKGKKAIILDVDDCIAAHHGDILGENLEIISQLQWHGWRICIFSNMKKTQRYQQLEELGIQVITSPYAKPDVRWFQDCLEHLWTLAQETVCIGDNYLTDGWSKQAEIDFIKIKPIRTDIQRSIKRKVQIAFQDLIDNIAQKRGHLSYK